MKYITEHPKTKDFLEEWAGKDTLVMSSCFFWSAGTDLQKNQAGLLRSLLSSILSQHPGLISVVFANLYDNLMASNYSELIGDFDLGELKAAFSNVCALKNQHIRVCLFIDGLDEYTGDQLSLVETISSSASNSVMLKALVSSRPESLFNQAFEKLPQLRLELLTATDISYYVSGSLEENARFLTLGKEIQARPRG
ncbi:hypothetical protein BS50DRAFT_498299 [Corynespora cassiicola Philippines]|uniref:Nephrocystin 3-like N-terminal domain-containing protein n=1 Tax=Corynespora cassiicola Philippines TaxID=1448308 RepID=A0A2T2NHX7_CORCC|nr:hypothetical protein BS50DRAFT_498299 [Corynespora cassiicola Philippines]